MLGHRGARHAAPENTLAAFELARSEGADGVELDVRLDGDGRVIVLHDPTLTRVTSGAETRHAEDLSSAELGRLDLGKGERVPLLADVLGWAREHQQRVNVELKSDVRNRKLLLTQVARVIGSVALPEVLFSSFDPHFVWWLARHLPKSAGLAGTRQTARVEVRARAATARSQRSSPAAHAAHPRARGQRASSAPATRWSMSGP